MYTQGNSNTMQKFERAEFFQRKKDNSFKSKQSSFIRINREKKENNIKISFPTVKASYLYIVFQNPILVSPQESPKCIDSSNIIIGVTATSTGSVWSAWYTEQSPARSRWSARYTEQSPARSLWSARYTDKQQLAQCGLPGIQNNHQLGHDGLPGIQINSNWLTMVCLVYR